MFYLKCRLPRSLALRTEDEREDYCREFTRRDRDYIRELDGDGLTKTQIARIMNSTKDRIEEVLRVRIK